MSRSFAQLLDLVVKDPEGARAELMKLSSVDRRALLDHAASGDTCRRLTEAFRTRGKATLDVLGLDRRHPRQLPDRIRHPRRLSPGPHQP